MANTLQLYFPQIRERQQVLDDILSKESTKTIYETWNEEQQNYFLDICCGVKGVKMLYDSFFKEILDPDAKPERLEDLLSLLLGQQVKILTVLPNDSTRIADESSLLIMDIVVRLEDGSIANVEVQRIGYAFPGQRSACYSADLLMRQYKRMKKRKKKNFKYSDIKKSYTIVFFEKSTAEFQKYPEIYIHRAKQKTDSGLQIDLLQEYIFVPLDIFKKHLHNKGIQKGNMLEAWLTFLSEDDPEYILKLISIYPKFKKLYAEVYRTCQNTEVMMGLFSKELLEMDKNTVDFMIDQMQDLIDEQKKQIEENKSRLDKQTKQLDEQTKQLDEQTKQLDEKDRIIAELRAKLEQK